MIKFAKYFFAVWATLYLVGAFVTFDFLWMKMLSSEEGVRVFLFACFWIIVCMVGAISFIAEDEDLK